MFDLKEAIEIWRKQAATHVPSDALEELEVHLEDAVEARIDEGMKAEDAFVLATHQLGNLQNVGKEITRESGQLPASIRQAHRLRNPWMAFAVPALACMTLLFVVEYFRAHFIDRYESQVTIEVHPNDTGSSVLDSDNKSIPSGKTVDMKTQLEVIRSRNTLYEVVDNYRLDEKWETTRVGAIDRLVKGLTVTQIGDATMARISYIGLDDPQMVANVTNAMAVAYQNRTRTVWKSMRNSELDMLHSQLNDQTDKVEDARLRMLDLAERYRYRYQNHYRVMPETVALANEAVEETIAATRAAELALEKGLDKPGEDLLRQELRVLREVEESFKDHAIDVRRKIAEYQEVQSEYELQSQMLNTMQEAYVAAQVKFPMPPVSISIREEAKAAINRLGMDWPDIWFSVFRNGWVWILGIGAAGWSLSGFLHDRREAAYVASALPASVTETKEDVLWA